MSNLPQSPASHSAPLDGPPTILLVDDDAKLLRGLQRGLDDRYRILSAVSPSEAKVIVAHERIELIISDNLMTGMLGTDFLREVHSEYPDIKLLMLSGYMPDAASRRVISECGVFQVLSKPCSAEDVANAIELALASNEEVVANDGTEEVVEQFASDVPS